MLSSSSGSHWFHHMGLKANVNTADHDVHPICTIIFFLHKSLNHENIWANLIKGALMTEDIYTDECADPTQNFTVELPCRMVERIERYARDKGTSVGNVMIEALDGLLRNVD